MAERSDAPALHTQVPRHQVLAHLPAMFAHQGAACRGLGSLEGLPLGVMALRLRCGGSICSPVSVPAERLLLAQQLPC